MKNKRSVYVNFTKLSSYIKKCFKDAYESLELPLMRIQLKLNIF